MNYKKLALGRQSSNVEDNRLRPYLSERSPERARSFSKGLDGVELTTPGVDKYIHAKNKAVQRTRTRPSTRSLDDWKKPLEE